MNTYLRKTESKVIGDFEYEVTQMGAVQGRKVFARLAKTIGPLLAASAGAKPDLEKIFGDMLGNIEPELVDFVCDSFAPFTTVTMQDGKKPRLSDIFDMHFAGNYQDMVNWIMFAMQVNFKTFLPKTP